jgi:Tol biopolymer transport system component
VDREPPAHGRAVYCLLAALAAACGGAPVDRERSASEGLVFVRQVGASSEIARARLADGAIRAVTETPEREEAWPYWSDAARRLVFEAASPEPGAPADLVLFDPETERETPVASTPGRDERWPEWAPHRSAFAFAFRGGDPPSGLALYDLAAGRAELLARGGERDFFLRPGFSPDGAILVAQRRASGGGGSGLWIAAPGAEPRALTADAEWFDWKPYFTRDGQQVVFSRRPAAGGPGRIAAIARSGGAVRELALPSGADLHSARPSPARDEVAYVAERDGAAEIFLADLAGGAPRALTRAAERQAFTPRWSPDGERIALVATPPGTPTPRLADRGGLAGASVLVIDREGRVLFETPGMMPDWMPPWR